MALDRKKCIVHVPNRLDLSRASGSQIRPYKMREAFEALGYEVDFIEGYGKERKILINAVKKNISEGAKYDFLYSESSTMPTLLTEKNHLPLYPDLDFGFFSYCRSKGIPVGLFYRDFHWKFPFYGDNVKGVKKIAALAAYRYDIIKYKKLLDRFFLPSDEAGKYFKGTKLEKISRSLLPGAVCDEEELEKKHEYYTERLREKNGPLRMFYVGGLGGHYQIEKLISGISKVEGTELTICCREAEWQKNEKVLGKYCGDNVKVVHEKGEGLKKYFRESDICLACFEHSDYMDMAMPIKVFEYLSYTIPVIATKDTAAGGFVNANNTGWTVDYSEEAIMELVGKLAKDYSLVYEKHESSRKALMENTWMSRAEKVIRELTE